MRRQLHYCLPVLFVVSIALAFAMDRSRGLIVYKLYGWLSSAGVHDDPVSPFGSGIRLEIAPGYMINFLTNRIVAENHFSYIRAESFQCEQLLKQLAHAKSINCLYMDNLKHEKATIADHDLEHLPICHELLLLNFDLSSVSCKKTFASLKHVSLIDCTLSQALFDFISLPENRERFEVGGCLVAAQQDLESSRRDEDGRE